MNPQIRYTVACDFIRFNYIRCQKFTDGWTRAGVIRYVGRVNGPEDYFAVMEESPGETERRRAAWPCTKIAALLSPDLARIG
jgi:hypothetical protein